MFVIRFPKSKALVETWLTDDILGLRRVGPPLIGVTRWATYEEAKERLQKFQAEFPNDKTIQGAEILTEEEALQFEDERERKAATKVPHSDQ